MTESTSGTPPSAAVIGQSIARREDHRFLTGRGMFLADIPAAGALHAAIVRSSLPAGRVVSVEPAGAEAAPGVVAVFTGTDFADALGPLPVLTTLDERFSSAFDVQASAPHAPCIAHEEVRYVGEPVAVIVATDRYLAEDAAEQVDVRLEPLEPVLSPETALSAGARPVNSSNPDNVGLRLRYAKGQLPEPPDDCVVIERTYRIGRHSGVPLEGRGVLAEPSRDRGVVVWSSTQVPFLLRRAICEATGWSPDRVRVRTPHVGGGFGPKANVYGEEILVPFIAARLGRSVRWVEDRYEHQVSAAHSRDQTHRVRLVVDREGHILSWEDDFVVDVGAHSLWMAGTVANTAIHLLGAYRIPACRISGAAVFTNKTPTAQYRGAGRPEAAFALERSLDAAARAIGVSRLKMRERNILSADDLPYAQHVPYRDGVDIVYDGRDYRSVLSACAALVRESELRSLRVQEESAGRRLGVGIATFIEATGRGPAETASLELQEDGTVLVTVGTASAGMSHETTLAQVAASALRRRVDTIRVTYGDTDGVPDSRGSFASRTAVVAGSAVHVAAGELVQRARALIARRLGVAVSGVAHGDDGFDLGDGEYVSWVDVAIYASKGSRLGALGHFEPETVTWTMGAHLAVVTVAPATGLVRVLRYAAADEIGTPINPRVVEGQVKGGIAQAIGGAMLEEFSYDSSGQPTATTFADYLLPGPCDVPPLRLAHVDAPSDRNPLGLRGIGESGAIAGYAAIASAVEDALSGYGVEIVTTPIRASDVRAWVRDAGG